MKRVMSNKKLGFNQLPCTGSKSTDFSGVHVSYSDIDRLNIDIDLLDNDDDDGGLPFLGDVPISPVISSSSTSSSSCSVDCIPATGLS